MRRGAWATVLAVLALAVAGCSEPEQPSTSLPTAVSTSAEPTLEPLGPADFPVPAEAREQTEAGAEAMAGYYLDLVDYYYADLPGGSATAEWLSALSANCELCDYYAALYVSWAERGYRYEGGDLTLESFGAVRVEAGVADVPLFVNAAEGRLYDAEGQQILTDSTPAMRQSGGVALSWAADQTVWLVTQVNLEEVPR